MDLEREWSQDELRAHLRGMGWTDADFIEGEIIPQGVKFLSNEPITERDREYIRKWLAANPEIAKRVAPR